MPKELSMGKNAERKALRPDVEPLLTVQEACSFIGVGTTTFYKWLADSELSLRAVAIELPNGRLRFPLDRLRSWLESRNRKP
jgi:excisionase family DNA binding protein